MAVTDLPGEKLDRMAQEFAATAEGRSAEVALDVTDRQSIAQGLERVVERWGGVDIVIILAGIALAGPLMDMSLEAFQKVERVNVEGTLLTLSEGSKLMAAQGTGGDFVLISSKNVFAPAPKFGAYSATKASSHQLGRIASQELAEFGIRVNMVSPDAIFSDGDIKSGLWALVGPDRMKSRGLDAPGWKNITASVTYSKMRVTAQHVANAVLFLRHAPDADHRRHHPRGWRAARTRRRGRRPLPRLRHAFAKHPVGAPAAPGRGNSHSGSCELPYRLSP